MGKRVVPEKITLDQNTSGITLTDSTADVLSDIVSYTVPDKSELIIEPTDFLYLALVDTAAAAVADVERCVALMTDPMGRRSRYLADGQYKIFQESQDSLKKFYFKQRVVIPADFILKIQVKDGVGVDISASAFALSCTLVYETLD